jgi:phenylacetate-CoA ligase
MINSNSVLLKQWLSDTHFFDRKVLSDGEKLIEQGRINALDLFQKASETIPAYKEFLKKNRIHSSFIKTYEDLVNVPVTTKENYIDAYPFSARCWNGSIDMMHMISTSSGTSGKPHFWPRDLQTEIEGAYAHEYLFRDVFAVDKKKTLFINGFALGNWIAGTFTSACVSLVAWKGYKVSLASPGYVSDGILTTIRELGLEFDQIIVSGHIPFLKEIVELGIKEGIDWSKLSVRLLGTGQGITENWRNYLLSLLKSQDFNSIVNLYGSADAALMGYETPLSIYLRKILAENYSWNKNLFHDERLPSLYNFDPRLIYFETEDDQLVITKNSGCPLIRYNIHDKGGVFSHSDLLSYFPNVTLSEFQKKNLYQGHQLPFVYLFGREKFMVKIYGANVYSEHVQHALNHEKLQRLVTGRYVLELGEKENHDPELICRVELASEIEGNQELASLIENTFVEEVSKINDEYRDVLKRVHAKGRPRILLYTHDHSTYFPKNVVKKTA